MKKWKISAAKRASGHWRHQDRYVVVPIEDGKRTCIAVLDGHGESEKTVNFCVRKIKEVVQRREIAENPLDQHILNVLVRELAEGTGQFKDGCAISVAILEDGDNMSTLMTIGDTFACAGSMAHGVIAPQWIKPHEVFGNDEERAALWKSGAKVSRGYVHDAKDKRMLAMSRSLGDAEFEGVISREPSFLRKNRDTNDNQFVILGTDGYFNMAMPERMDMDWLHGIEEKWSARQFLAAKTHELRSRADDATVVVAYLQ